jgi:hypothetical protein
VLLSVDLVMAVDPPAQPMVVERVQPGRHHHHQRPSRAAPAAVRFGCVRSGVAAKLSQRSQPTTLFWRSHYLTHGPPWRPSSKQTNGWEAVAG